MVETLYEWTVASWGELAAVAISSVSTYAAIILFTRVAGLRSFSKMSAADFAMTVAVGSIFAATISSAKPALAIGVAALALLFAGQLLLGYLRQKLPVMQSVVDNKPLLLMAGDSIIEENLQRAHVTRNDIYGKLREANALNYDEVLAVVFETTGDISVLHSKDGDAKLERDFLEGVVGAERLFVD